MVELTVGAFVYTADGKEIGRVKKSESSAFQVDAPLAFDFWLETSLVTAAESERVTLSVGHAEIGGYKMDLPHDQNGFQEMPRGMDPGAVRDRNLMR